MMAVGYILLVGAGIGSLICWIMTLILMFKNEKPLIGILGVLCALWAFIWGWMNSTKLNHKKIMLIWSLCIVVSIIGNVIATAGMISKSREMPQATPDSYMPGR